MAKIIIVSFLKTVQFSMFNFHFISTPLFEKQMKENKWNQLTLMHFLYR